MKNLTRSTNIAGTSSDFEVEQNPDTLYWQARGVIEFIEGETFRTFAVSGATNTFKTDAEAQQALKRLTRNYRMTGNLRFAPRGLETKSRSNAFKFS